MIAILIIIAIFLFFIMCVLSAIRQELEKTRLENREIVNILNKKKVMMYTLQQKITKKDINRILDMIGGDFTKENRNKM